MGWNSLAPRNEGSSEGREGEATGFVLNDRC
jgi:hypothetical protein